MTTQNRLREACIKIRTTPMPIVDLVPLMQQAADDLDALREILAIRCCGPTLYLDDGEMSDCSVHPAIDFKRDTPREIFQKLAQRQHDAQQAAKAAI